jgi:hydrogenase maturation protein HypF
MRVRSRIHVEGVVHGVGFRPFVRALAHEYGVTGLVRNDDAGVVIEAEGAPAAVGSVVDALTQRPPPLAVIERVSVSSQQPTGRPGFEVVPGRADHEHPLIGPDSATCADCLAELCDPADRRYRYPFINCTNCGPRFTIATAAPYERANTTMADFAMCPACAREYADPRDRRYRAEPLCCPDCGPTLRLTTPDGTPVPGDPLRVAAGWLARGAVVSLKGLGGYHLVVDATSDSAVAAVRSRKGRPDKPFAVMVCDLAAARDLCRVDRTAADLLAGPTRPIVLLPRRPDAPLADAVAPGTSDVGVVLPHTALEHLLARELGRPLVVTSANRCDEPIVHRDDEARTRLRPLADVCLGHDRPVRMHSDDSVMRVFRGSAMPLRRARGYAPRPLRLRWRLARPVLGCGTDRDTTFCLASGEHAIVSHHIGGIGGDQGRDTFTRAVTHLRRLLDTDPAVIAHDLDPHCPTTSYARQLADADLVAVQHHHAHVAACLADNDESGPAIGLVLDTPGHGTDGTTWGGELLLADLTGFTRAGHLAPVPTPGPLAARQPWRMAAAYLLAAYGPQPPDDLAVVRRHAGQWPAVVSLATRGDAAPPNSSAVRLLDAVAALVGLRDEVSYEAQSAVELEHLADPQTFDAYPATVAGDGTGAGDGVDDDGTVVIAGTDLVRGVVDDLRRGVAAPVIAARFLRGLAGAAVTAACRVAEATGVRTVALSGGMFCQPLLLGAVDDGLRRHHLRVLRHRRVPGNDGGVSLGQVVVAGARELR